jgi:hypothetical protein
MMDDACGAVGGTGGWKIPAGEVGSRLVPPEL